MMNTVIIGNFDKNGALLTHHSSETITSPFLAFPTPRPPMVARTNAGAAKCRQTRYATLIGSRFCREIGSVCEATTTLCDLQTHQWALARNFPSGSPTPQHRFHVATAHHCSVWPNIDTFSVDFTTWPILLLAKVDADWALEEVGRERSFQEGGGWWSRLRLVLNIHVNNRRAGRRSVCINLLLLARWSTPQKKVQERPAVADRSTIQPYTRTVAIAWWSPGGMEWPGCCGFVKLPVTDHKWPFQKTRQF